MNELDRRVFLQRAGVAGMAAGAAWIAPSVLGSQTAFAGASCLQGTGSILWNAWSGQTPPTSFVRGPAGNQVTITRAMTTVGTPTPVNGNNTVATNLFGGTNHSYYQVWMNNGSNWNGSGYDVAFTFNKPLYNVQFTLIDIDQSYGSGNNYIDDVWLTATGTNPTFSATYPGGGGRTFSGAGTTASHWLGTSQAQDGSTSGNAAVTFAGPITGFTISYRSQNNDTTVPIAGTTQQAIGLNNITFCL